MNRLNEIRFRRSKNDEAGGIVGEIISIIFIVIVVVVVGGLYMSIVNNRTDELSDYIKSPKPTSTVSPTPGSTTPSNTGW